MSSKTKVHPDAVARMQMLLNRSTSQKTVRPSAPAKGVDSMKPIVGGQAQAGAEESGPSSVSRATQ